MSESAWSKAFNAIGDRVEAAYQNRYNNKPSEPLSVTFSAYSTDGDDIPIDNLDKVPVAGRMKFVAEPDSWSTKRYESPVVESPTWLEIVLLADDMIKTIEDFHHVFLENIRHARTEADGTRIYHFTMGS
jgi:hypothetical protein